MTASPPEDIHIGDIWRENDMRFERFVKVLRISADGTLVEIRSWDRGLKAPTPRSRPTWAKLSRFGNGYVRP